MTHRCEDHSRISEMLIMVKTEAEHLKAQDAATLAKLDQLETRLRQIEIRAYLIVGGLSILSWFLKLIIPGIIPAARAAIGG